MRRAHVSVLVLVLVASVAAPGEAAAATTCSGVRSNFFDGYYTTTQNTTGTTAIIKTKSPTICTGASTFSSAWSMITALPQSAGWAQTGYIREKDHLNGALSGFSQRLRLVGEVPVTKFFGPPAQDSTHSYQSFVNANGFIVMFIDANQVDISTWKPTSYWGSQPWSSQYAGETGHCQGDVPGLAITKAHFTNVVILKNGSWVAPGAMTSLVNCGTKYGQAIVNATALDIWTEHP